MLLMCHLVLPRDSKQHPLNSADRSVVRNTKRYTLTRRVATAMTLITIRGIPRHTKLKSSTPEPAGTVRADAEVQTRAGCGEGGCGGCRWMEWDETTGVGRVCPPRPRNHPICRRRFPVIVEGTYTPESKKSVH